MTKAKNKNVATLAAAWEKQTWETAVVRNIFCSMWYW